MKFILVKAMIWPSGEQRFKIVFGDPKNRKNVINFRYKGFISIRSTLLPKINVRTLFDKILGKVFFLGINNKFKILYNDEKFTIINLIHYYDLCIQF